MKKLLKKMKNVKFAKGRIIGLAGPCYYIYMMVFGGKEVMFFAPID